MEDIQDDLLSDNHNTHGGARSLTFFTRIRYDRSTTRDPEGTTASTHASSALPSPTAGKKPASKAPAEKGAKRKRWGEGRALGSTNDSEESGGAGAAAAGAPAGTAAVPRSWRDYEKNGWVFQSDAVAQLDREQAGELGPWVSSTMPMRACFPSAVPTSPCL